MLRNRLRPTSLVVAAACGLSLAVQGCGWGVGSGTFASGSSSPSTTQAVSAPSVLGYAWIAVDHTLRPILGIVGSSRAGLSVIPAGTYSYGAASAASSAALLLRPDGSVDRAALPGSPAAFLAAGTASANATVHFSPSGTNAVIFSVGGSTLILVADLLGVPHATPLTVSSALVDAAVSDNGTVAVLQRQGNGTQLAALVQSGAPRPVSSLSGRGAMNFLAKRDDLLFADAGANSLTVVRNFSATPTVSAVPSANLLKTPVAVGVSADGRWAIVANGAEASVARFDLNSLIAAQRIACPVQPSTVEQLSGDANFRFSDIGRSPAWVSDVSAQPPAMMFVPAVTGL